jgi:hypothetical protein
MSSPLSFEIRNKLYGYLAGDFPLSKFQDWFIPATWDVERSGDPDAVELAHEINLLLAELSHGDWTEEELRDRLSHMTVHHTAGPEMRISTGTASTVTPSSEALSLAFDIQPVVASA